MTYLDNIVRGHRKAAQNDARRLQPLLRLARSCPPVRGFAHRISDHACGTSEGAITDTSIAVIAEIKRRSPSKGDLRAGLNLGKINAADLARSYEMGGAACLSVLTDETWFGGSAQDLRQARAATNLPVLRKDFTVDARNIADARIMGADCVLLIAAVLSHQELAEFCELSRSLGIDALVEVHDEAELEQALEADARIVGVNQRDLLTFEVDQARAVRLAPLIPEGIVRVAESGIRGPEDVQPLADAGYHAVLIGETLVRSTDPTAAVQALRNPHRTR